jgi:hypothetical protein
MARTQTAYLNRQDVPARKSLQEAVDQLGFKLTLDDSYKPFESEGYLPCTMDGEDAGFDLRFEEVAESGSDGRDVAIKFRWSGDPREQLAALAVCAALVKRFGAVVREPGENESLPFEELLAKARDLQECL